MKRCCLRKPLTEYRAVILDMDGTLYYQRPLRMCMAFELFFYYLAHLSKWRELLMLTAYREAREAGRLPAPDAVIDAVVKRWMQERPLKYVRLFRDRRLIALAERLRRGGAKLAVYSDYPVAGKLAALSPFTVDFAFDPDDPAIPALKPDPRGLRYITGVIGEAAEDTVFIGDRHEKDGLCAKAAGVDYVILGKSFFSRNMQLQKITGVVYD